MQTVVGCRWQSVTVRTYSRFGVTDLLCFTGLLDVTSGRRATHTSIEKQKEECHHKCQRDQCFENTISVAEAMFVTPGRSVVWVTLRRTHSTSRW